MLSDTELLGDQLSRRATCALPHPKQVDELLRIAAARPPHTWAESLDQLSEQRGLDPTRLRERLLQHVQNGPDLDQRRPQAPQTTRTGTPRTITWRSRTPTSHDQHPTSPNETPEAPHRSVSAEAPRR